MARVLLKDLSKEKFKKFIDSFDIVMSDIDGTVYLSGPLPGVPEFFNYLEKFGKSVYYVSNNSLLTPAEYSSRMKKCSLDVPADNIIYPSKAVIDYLRAQNFDKHIFCIAAQETIDDLTSAGFKCKTGPVPGPRRYIEYPAIFKDDPEIGAVFIDHDFHINMAKAYMASVYLERPEVLFLEGATDQVAALRRGNKNKAMVFLPNVMTPLIGKYSGRQPVVLSKPGKPFIDFVNKHAGVVDPERVLFIGDCLETDIDFGIIAGYKTLFVLTTTNYVDMVGQSKIVPDYYANNLAEILPLMSHL